MTSNHKESNCPAAILQGRKLIRAIAGVYLHVPFCGRKCGYCDFYSVIDGDPGEAFVAALIAELDSRAEQVPLAPRTIFVGGGTPTLLAPASWRLLLARLERLGAGGTVREFTVEANPESLTEDLASILVAGGVNRVSIGAQTTHPQLLATLDRRHEAATVNRAVASARRAGIANISLDYIFAIPGQTMAMLDADIDAAVALGPEHLSFYELTCERGTELARQVARGLVQTVSAERQRRMYERVIHRLDVAGYEHYEISNWSIRGPARRRQGAADIVDYRCQHNLVYWRNENWLGFGPSAASGVDGFRWQNQPDLTAYLRQPGDPPTIGHEHLPAPRRIGEQLMLGLRLRQGVSCQWLSQHLPAADPRHVTIEQMIDLDMLERTATHLRLTQRGLFVADTVIAKLL